jgi:hypothetical protein
MNVRQHPTLPNIFVQADGRIFQEVTASLSSFGYHTVHIGGQTIRRHTIVAETYIGPRPPGHGVRHLDGNSGNDHANNLAWGTQAENTADTVKHGRSTRGTRNARAKLTDDQAREIRARRIAGESGRSLAAEFGISERGICDLFKGRTWAWLPD